MRRIPLACAVLLLTGCGSFARDPGPPRTQERTVEAVAEVELATSGDLTLTTGDTPSLRITAGEDVLDDLTSEVRGDRLVLDTKGSIGRLGDVTYELVLPAARVLELSGSGDLRATAPSAVGEIALSGSGELHAEGLTTEELRVELSGSGSITLDGRVQHQTVALDGSGEYDAARLDSRDAEVTIAGSGSADVQVSGTLQAVIEGSGDITYGGGATVERRIDGSGSVSER